MESKSLYKVSVGSASEYEELIAEILFENNFGLIISQEKGEGNFEISVHSFIGDAGKNFDFTRNIVSAKIPLEVLGASIQEALSELRRLARK